MLGGGAGTIMDAIIRHRNNMELLRKKSLFRKEFRYITLKNEYLKAVEGKLDLKKATKEQLLEIRLKVKEQHRKDFLKIAIALTVVTALIIYVTANSLKPGKNNENPVLQAQIDVENKKKQDDYLFYINDGDEWLRQAHWNNAIYQYKTALDVFPEDYEARYRLAMAYTYKCSSTQEDCEEAIKLIRNLRLENGSDENLIKLSIIYFYAVGDSVSALNIERQFIK